MAVEAGWMHKTQRRKFVQVGPSTPISRNDITDPRFHLTGKQVTAQKIIDETVAKAIAVVFMYCLFMASHTDSAVFCCVWQCDA